MESLFSSLHLRSLRVQILLWTIAPLTILLILFSLTGIGTHQASMRELAGQENVRLLQVMANAIASQVESKTASVEAAAQLVGHDYADAAMRNLHLATASRVLAGSDLAIFDASDSLVVAEPALPKWLDQTAPALLPVDTVALLAATPTGSATVVWRVKVPEQPVWLVAGESIDELVGRSGLRLHSDEHVSGLVLADGQNRPLYQYGAGATLALASLVAVPSTLEDSGFRFERAEGQEYAVAYAQVPGTDWRLLLREPWHGLSSPPILLERLTPFALLIAVVVSFLTLLFGLLFIVRPLRSLGERTRKIGKGNFAAAGETVGGVDEIEELRQAVDQMARQIQSYQAGLQSYLHAVTRAQEDERARLARDLHDETIQTLTALDHKIQKLERSLKHDPTTLPPNLDELHRMVAGATAEVRRFSRALRPLYLEDLGLAPALKILAEEAGAGFTLVGTPRRVAPELELALYRIAQESLSNVRRHAHANQVEVTLVFAPSQARLTVSDDGCGFDPPTDLSALARSGHFGLMSMHERAQLVGAQITIDASEGQGASVTVSAAIN